MHTPNAKAVDQASLGKHFGGGENLLPLWIAEPYVDLAPPVVRAIRERAATGWYGYEVRPDEVLASFWDWMVSRHGWDGSALRAQVSPSIGTSIAVAIDRHSNAGDGVILQPPVFTDFKQLIRSAGRQVVRNPLMLTSDGYRMDLEDLAAKAADQSTRMMILCNPHNPVGRAWRPDELNAVAGICADNDVLLISDEIHADIMAPGSRFTPIATVPDARRARWIATHGPIKTFGLAGICDSLIVTDDEDLDRDFRSTRSRFRFSRNNVLGLVAFETAYREGGPWLDSFLDLTSTNMDLLREHLPTQIGLVEPESTYLAWLDFRPLGLDVPELSAWLSSSARLALSPGHWFGREGAGFARMTVAVPTEVIADALERITAAVQELGV